MQICEACRDYETCKLPKREHNDYLAHCEHYEAERATFTVDEVKEIIRKAARPVPINEVEAVTPEVALETVLEIEKQCPPPLTPEEQKICELRRFYDKGREGLIEHGMWEEESEDDWSYEMSPPLLGKQEKRSSFLTKLLKAEIVLCLACGKPLNVVEGKKKPKWCKGDRCRKAYHRRKRREEQDPKGKLKK